MYKKRKHAAFAAVIAAQMLPALGHAENLSPLVVTAGRMAENPANISADTTVITQKDIAASQATTVADILRSQNGIDVASSGGPGKATSVFIRGGNSGHTLVLIDGVRVGSATLGSFDWANLSTADIERIEIVRGAQSSLYGADAMGGVIQIFTRQGKKGTQVRVHAETGSYATSSGSMSVTGKTESDISYALTVNGLRTDSVSAAAKGKEKDPYHQTTLSGRIGLPVGDGELELIARNVDGTTGLDGGFPFGDVLNYTSQTKQAVNSAKLTYPLSDIMDTSLQISRSSDEVIGRDPAGGFNNSDFKTQIDQLTWQNHIDMDALSLLIGADMYRSKGYSGSAKLNQSMTQKAAFASLAWSKDILGLNASLRYDQNSVSQNKATYKVGAALHPTKSLKITANYGTGFKAPSLNDLYFPASAFSAGNPNLKPESSKGWDAGVAYEANSEDMSIALSATWFDQKYQDLIAWQPSPTFFYSPVNVGQAQTKGLELSGKIVYGAAYIRANWTYLDAKDTLTGKWLARRAKESGNIALGGTWAGLHAELAESIVGPRFSSAGNAKYMKGYHKGDLRLSYALNQQWKLTARVDNIENKKYEEVSGYGVLGRAGYAGVSATF